MKWLALILLAINAAVWFGSEYWRPARVQIVATDKTLPRVATLKVDGTAQEEVVQGLQPPQGVATQLEARPQPSAPKSQSTAPSSQLSESQSQFESEAAERVCVKLGWFDTAENAQEAYQSIGGPGSLLSVAEEERGLDPLHWVIIPPQPEDQALALFNDLQNREIDSYLVTRGENTNAISLGLFQSRDAAERVLAAKKRQNLNAILANFPRNQLSYALVFEVPQVDSSETGDGRIRDYRDDFEMVEISGCEGIATTPENP